jgi:rod shape determining protein RodA
VATGGPTPPPADARANDRAKSGRSARAAGSARRDLEPARRGAFRVLRGGGGACCLGFSAPVKFSPAHYLSLFRPVTRGRWDRVSPLAMGALGLVGVAFIRSAQLQTHGADWRKQLTFLALGAAVYTAVALVDYRFWLGVAHWIYLGTLVPLALVLVPGVGAVRGGAGVAQGGARRWLDFGPVSFQPSELAKAAVLLMAASLLVSAKLDGPLSRWRDALGVLGKLALAAGAPVLLILLQPDLKPVIVLPPMIFAMLHVSRFPARLAAGALAVFLLVAGVVAWDTVRYKNFIVAQAAPGEPPPFRHEDKNWSRSWVPLRDYQRNRLVSFLWPDLVDPMGVGWNQRQSLIAVGSGGLTGKGYAQGTQAQLGYLPRAVSANDFISSVIAEESGFLGSLTVLGLFGVVLFNGVRIAGLARDRFGCLLAIGVTAVFAVHVFVNIAMTIGLVPITGIPLPFVSYGGSFVLGCCLLQGLVQSVYRFRKDLP